MKIVRLLCSVAACSLLASNAMAADLLYSSPPPEAACNCGPVYLGLRGGVSWTGGDQQVSILNDPGGPDILSFDSGFNAGVVGGYAFAQHWGTFSPRAEVELGYLHNNLSSFREDSAAVTTPATGDIHAFYGLANLLLDIPINGFGFTPFVGAGIGFANTRSTVTITGLGVDQSVDDTNFAWDVTAGAAYNISCNITFDISYRFLQLTSVTSIVNGLTPSDTPGFASSTDIDNHQVNAGVRVHI
jgi:opacity protein-like surface antigen